MQRRFIVDGDFLTGLDVAQRDEKDVPVKDLHVGIRFAGMVNVMRAVTPTAAVKTPALINRANAKLATVGPSICFCILDLLTGILGYFPAAFEMSN